jgi:hypothetical protein
MKLPATAVAAVVLGIHSFANTATLSTIRHEGDKYELQISINVHIPTLPFRSS